jgi:hypothetical protein
MKGAKFASARRGSAASERRRRTITRTSFSTWASRIPSYVRIARRGFASIIDLNPDEVSEQSCDRPQPTLHKPMWSRSSDREIGLAVDCGLHSENRRIASAHLELRPGRLAKLPSLNEGPIFLRIQIGASDPSRRPDDATHDIHFFGITLVGWIFRIH